MALHFDCSEIADYQSVTTAYNADGTARWHPVTNALIWATIPVGIAHITEDNAQEFFVRLWMMERVTGATLDNASGEPSYLTLEDVRLHIGLRTNASRRTRAQFMKALGEMGEAQAINYDRNTPLHEMLQPTQEEETTQ